MTLRFFLASALAAVAVPSSADDPVYSIDAHILSSGASSVATSNCYRLSAVIGEPVAGFSSGGGYALNAGFLAAIAIDDSLFANGFEDCSQ